jgi:hypothetical protein
MKSEFFILEWRDVESYYGIYFVGPAISTRKDFVMLCDSLLENAGYMALATQTSWIDWCSIVEALVPLLEKQGYYRFLPKIASYNGNIIETRDETKGLNSAADLIINHNQALAKRIRLRK